MILESQERSGPNEYYTASQLQQHLDPRTIITGKRRDDLKKDDDKPARPSDPRIIQHKHNSYYKNKIRICRKINNAISSSSSSLSLQIKVLHLRS